MKRCILIVLGLISFAAHAYDFEVDGVYYDIVSPSDFTCEVAPSPNRNYSGDIVIPGKVTYNNRQLTVVSIGYTAFKNCSSLTSIALPETLTVIGESAFSDCTSLTSIVLPETLTSIKDYAFSHCTSLTSIVLPETLESIMEGAFYDCTSLTSIVLPETLTVIMGSAFSGCTSLASITLSEGLRYIGRRAFYNCRSLTTIKIPDSVTDLYTLVFEGCASLENIQLGKGLSKLESGTFSRCSSLSSLAIPGNIGRLVLSNSRRSGRSNSNDLFYECIGLKELIIEYSPEYLRAVEGFSTYSDISLMFALEFSYSYNKMNIDKTLPIERATIDRELSNSIQLDSLKHYTIGGHVTKNQVDLNLSKNLESITCLAEVPPTGMNDLTNIQYANIAVKVPIESLDSYKNAEGWKNFWNIEGIELSGIRDMGVDNSAEGYIVYNLQGIMVLKTDDKEDVMQLPKGIYIVNRKKMAIR